MAYQRFGTDSDLYIWMSLEALHIWIAEQFVTETVSRKEGIVELKFNEKNIKEAETLFLALADILQSNGRKIKLEKNGTVRVKKNG